MKPEVAVGELVGWRTWYARGLSPSRTVAQRPWLDSIFVNHRWHPTVTVQGNIDGFFSTWLDGIPTGIYAYNSVDPILEIMREHIFKDEVPMSLVCGQVWLWGRVAIHERGYRASFAYPKSLFLHSGNKEWEAAVDLRWLREKFELAEDDDVHLAL